MAPAARFAATSVNTMASSVEVKGQSAQSSVGELPARVRHDVPNSTAGRNLHRIRLIVAVIFAAATIFYSAIWMYYIRMVPKASLGLDFTPNLSQQCVLVTRVEAGGPADRAGIRPGDHIVSVYGRPFRTIEPIYTSMVGGRAGEAVSLGVMRGGQRPAVSRIIVLDKARPPQHPRTVGQK